MEFAFIVYLVSILDSLREGLGGFAFLGVVVGGIVVAVSYIIGDPEFPKPLRVLGYAAFFIGIFSGIARMILPTEKAGYVIAGAYATQKIVENPNVQEIGGKVLAVINQKLDKTISEGVEEANKKVENLKKKVSE